MSRRANGEGTISKRKDGRYDVKMRVDGVRRAWTAPTMSAAKAWIDDERRKARAGLSGAGPGSTVGQYLDEWVETVVRPTREYATYMSYKGQIDNHIKPAIGRVRLNKLQPRDVQRMVAWLGERGVSPVTIQRIRAALRSALSHAERMELVSRNVAKLVELPKVSRPRVTPPTREQLAQVLSYAADHPLRPLIVLAACTGMRRGELLALRWSDVDFDNGFVAVTRSLKYGPGALQVVGKTKTDHSLRRVPIYDQTIDELRRHRAAQNRQRLAAGARWEDNNLVFPTAIGTHMDGTNLSKRVKALVKRAGVPQFRFHDLRRHGSETGVKRRA